MAHERRIWTAAQKLAILNEAELAGIAQTCRKHQLAKSMIGKWRNKLEKFGPEGLEPRALHVTPELDKVAEENRRLKQLVADQALELQLLREIQKKNGCSLEAKRQVMNKFLNKGYSAGLLLRLLELPRSTYYYKPGSNPPGRKSSQFTALSSGELVSNQTVITQMRDLLGEEFVDYGYRKVTEWLKWRHQYVINHKKVLRLMRMHGLMLPTQHDREAQERITEKVPQPSGPREVIELDIKHIYIHALNKHALILNFIDLFHREWLPYYVGWSIRTTHVMKMIMELFGNLVFVRIRLRSDNGSQFIAKERYILDEEISREDYEEFSYKLRAEKQTILGELEQTNKKSSNLLQDIRECVEICRNLAALWRNGDYRIKQKVQQLVFPEGMAYSKEIQEVRTARVNEVIRVCSETSKFLSPKHMGQEGVKTVLPHWVAPPRIELGSGI